MGSVGATVLARGLGAMLALFLTPVAAAAEATQHISLTGSAVRFTVPVNLKAFTIHGRVDDLSGSALLDSGKSGFVLRDIKVSVPVESIDTGIAVRDRHMRERVFQTTSGELPAVTFVAEEARCPRVGERARCTVAGTLSIRGTARPFSIDLDVGRDERGYRASGVSIVRLSDYGIERPRQFGVITADEILLEVDLCAMASLPPVPAAHEE